MGKGVRQATLIGLRWGTVLQVGQSLLSVLVTLVLVRLLDQADFGLLALMTTIIVLMLTVVELGLGPALIQRHTITEEDISTAFFSNVVLGALMTALVALMAPWFARFWEEPALADVLRVSSVLLFIRSFASVPTALYERELNLRPLTTLTMAAVVFGSLMKIALAWIGLGVWSLVLGEIATQLTLVICLLVKLHRSFSPALFRPQRLADLFRFGRSVSATNLLNNLSTNVDVLVVGKVLSAGLLGVYTIALTISTLLSKTFNAIIQRIAFPAFSRVQHDREKLRKGYIDALQYSTLLVVGPTVGLGLVADDFVAVVLSDKWSNSVVAIQILVLYATANALGGALWGQVLKALGRVELLLGMSVVRVVALPAAIAMGSPWGLVGVCWAIAIYSIVFRLLFQLVVNKQIGIRMRDFFGAVAPSLYGCVVMASSVAAAELILRTVGSSEALALICKSVAGAVAYIGGLMLMRPELMRALWDSVITVRGGVRRATEESAG